MMTTSAIYRTVAVLLALYAAGHTLGFSRVRAEWGVDGPIAALRSTTFTAGGAANRTFWGFFLGFGYFCGVLLLFCAALAWQLGGLPADVLAALSLLRWAFALLFAALTVLTWRYFFMAPVIFSLLITIGLFAGAWLGGR